MSRSRRLDEDDDDEFTIDLAVPTTFSSSTVATQAVVRGGGTRSSTFESALSTAASDTAASPSLSYFSAHSGSQRSYNDNNNKKNNSKNNNNASSSSSSAARPKEKKRSRGRGVISPALMSRVGSRALAIARDKGDTKRDRSKFEHLINQRRLSGNQPMARDLPSDISTKDQHVVTSIRADTATVISDQTSGSARSSQQPLPQNLRGDPFRSAKVKTELCRNFVMGKHCPFGDKCNYAHGEHELKYTKLVDLERAGLVDLDTYRTHPCPTWVATGSCPFDLRCTGLHDPRVSSCHHSWLPHAETAVNSIGTEVNVDRLYHQKMAEVYRVTPFPDFHYSNCWKLRDKVDIETIWKEFYSYVCNLNKNVTAPQDIVSGQKSNHVSEIHRIAIAVKMREPKMGRSYMYQPTHVIYGELCMILQSRAFKVVDIAVSQSSYPTCIREVPMPDDYWSQHDDRIERISDYDNIIIAHEVVFGSVGDPSVRPLSICINISRSDISTCTPQQARRHKRTRNRIVKSNLDTVKSYSPTPSLHASSIASMQTSSVSGVSVDAEARFEEGKNFDSSENPLFSENQPIDDDAFDLVTNVLKHRLKVLVLRETFIIGLVEEDLRNEEKGIRRSFESQYRYWVTWAWPTNDGREKVDEETDVPPVDGYYRFIINDNFGVKFKGDEQQEAESRFSPGNKIHHSRLATGFVWISFMSNFKNGRESALNKTKEGHLKSHADLFPILRRLPVLRSLSLGNIQGGCNNRSLPQLEAEEETCSDGDATSSSVTNFSSLFKEWSVVQTHYEKNLSGVEISFSSISDFGSEIGTDSDVSSLTRMLFSRPLVKHVQHRDK